VIPVTLQAKLYISSRLQFNIIKYTKYIPKVRYSNVLLLFRVVAVCGVTTHCGPVQSTHSAH